MYKQITVAIDGTELTAKVLEHAFALARATGAALEVVTVTEQQLLISPGAEVLTLSTVELMDELEKAQKGEATAVLDSAKAAASAAGVEVKVRHVPRQHPSDGIILAAEEGHADLIVMGSHGRRGLNRLLLGSQASEVLARSKVPVLIVK